MYPGKFVHHVVFLNLHEEGSMKFLAGLSLGMSALFLIIGDSSAGTFDLSTFTAQEWVAVDQEAGTAIFTEDMTYSRGYLFNDNYPVEENATALSFDYSLTYGPDDYDDYFLCELNDIPVLVVSSPASGRATVDLIPYRGADVALDWGLFWGGSDSAAGTVATISNIELETGNPISSVPVPAAMTLLGSGLIILFGMERKFRKEKL